MNKGLIQIDEPGTCYQFGIIAKYADLVEKLGEPNIDDDPDKVDASWSVEDDSGRRLSIWNYKNGPNYLGTRSGVSVASIENWSGWGSRELAEELGFTIR